MSDQLTHDQIDDLRADLAYHERQAALIRERLARVPAPDLVAEKDAATLRRARDACPGCGATPTTSNGSATRTSRSSARPAASSTPRPATDHPPTTRTHGEPGGPRLHQRTTDQGDRDDDHPHYQPRPRRRPRGDQGPR